MTFKQMEEAYYKDFYEHEDYDKAIALAEKAFKTYPEHHEQIYLDLTIFYHANGQHDLCKKFFSESLDHGYWYPKAYLKDIFEDEAYLSLITRWTNMTSSRDEVRIFVQKPTNYNPMRAMPLMVSLHGWGEDHGLFSRFWQSPILSSDYIHVFIESSQQIGYRHFCWDDRQRAFKDVENTIQKLKGQYAIGKILFSGFSQGGHLAIDLAFNSKVPGISGFIALNPSISDLQMTQRDLKGYIITGDQDYAFEAQQEFVDRMRSQNKEIYLDVKVSWGHWFPSDLSKRLDQALTTINLA